MEPTIPAHPQSLHPSLETPEKIEQVDRLYRELVSHFTRKAKKNKSRYQLYKYASIVLTACTSILTGWQVAYDGFPQWLLSVASAGATVSVALLGASNVQKVWVSSRTTGQRLKAEQFLFNQEAALYSGLNREERVRRFAERVVSIWNEGHGRWEESIERA